MKKYILLSTTIVSGMLFAAPAIAQQSTGADEAGIQDIVVTAQRRDENLQKAAVAVSVVSGDALTRAGVSTAQDLTKLVPALQLSSVGGGGTQVTIRGVGNFAGNAFAEPAVAVNMDGVYLARSSGPNGLYYDLERVEVLKGPQGTLYGRNATAGAINIIARKPQREFGGQGSFEYGNFNKWRGELALNLPVTDYAALRVAGVISRHDGYYKDGYNDDKTEAVRAQLLLDSGGSVTVLLAGDYSHVGGQGPTGVVALTKTGFTVSDPYVGPSLDGSNAILTGVSNFLTSGANPNLLPKFKNDGFIDIANWGISATINYDLGGAQLTVIPAYRNSKSHYLHYNAGFPVRSDEYSEATSVEARLASTDKGAALQWLLGAYYFHEAIDFDLRPFQGVAYGVTQPILGTRSLAAFGQLTYSVADNVRLTGGLRYTDEKKDMDGQLGNGPGPGFPVAFVPLTGKISDSSVTWKAGIEFDVAPASMLYANVGTGFKAGGFFASQAPNTSRPEKITAYTIGSKNRFFGNTLQLNAEGFYWKYKDKQVTHIGPIRPGGFNLITENAGAAEIYGAEVELLWQPTNADRLSANAQYLHSKYNSFVYTQTILTGPAQTACAITPIAGQPAVSVDCSGRVLPRAPKWTVNLSYQHSFDIGSAGGVDAQVGTRIESETVLGEEYLAGQYQKGYTLSNASLTWHDADNRYYVSAYVDNIEDETVKTMSFVQPVVGLPLTALGAPRTYGVRAGFKF
ncbi:TonB-denpendent receptor [Novosphingobium lubricantis]|jgi:iron complex outermembrane receptor protein